MSTPSENTNEERALDALMAAAFRAEGQEQPLSEEEARHLVDNPPPLSPEDEEALASMGPDFVEKLLKSAHNGDTETKGCEAAADAKIEEACAAMNRGREDDELDKKARQEIERKRRELLGEPEPEAPSDEEEQDES